MAEGARKLEGEKFETQNLTRPTPFRKHLEEGVAELSARRRALVTPESITTQTSEEAFWADARAWEEAHDVLDEAEENAIDEMRARLEALGLEIED